MSFLCSVNIVTELNWRNKLLIFCRTWFVFVNLCLILNPHKWSATSFSSQCQPHTSWELTNWSCIKRKLSCLFVCFWECSIATFRKGMDETSYTVNKRIPMLILTCGLQWYVGKENYCSKVACAETFKSFSNWTNKCKNAKLIILVPNQQNGMDAIWINHNFMNNWFTDWRQRSLLQHVVLLHAFN